MSRRINPDRDAKIIDLNRLGLYCSEIAREVGFTKEGVRCALIRLGEAPSHRGDDPTNWNLHSLLQRKMRPGPNGCLEWQGANHKGYGQIRIGYELWFAHRVSFHLYVGPIPTDLHVLHACDNPPCINPEHLFLGTHEDNMQDKMRKGRYVHGKRHYGPAHHMAKFTMEQVEEIRRLCQEGMLQVDLAKRYGVHRMTIQNMVNRRTYAE